MASHTVSKYQLVIHDKQRIYNYQGLGARHPDAQILISTSDGWKFRLYFLPDDEQLVEHYSTGATSANLFLFSRQYAACVDLLRNESPAYVHWQVSDFYLATGLEIPGEGEH